MKNLLYSVATIALLMPAAASAFEDDYLFPTDSRIKILPYDESDVYTIPTKYGYQTSIVLNTDEEIYTLSVGDRSVWQIVPAANRLFIRPMDENSTTNMTVITNKRTYHFDLKALAADAKTSSIVYTAKFVYPEDTQQVVETSPYDAQITDVLPDTLPVEILPPATPSSAKKAAGTYDETSPVYIVEPVDDVYRGPEPTMQMPAASGTINNRYTYAGPDELAPLQVYDNGRSTFFKYRAANQPMPNAYLVDKTGQQKPVAHYVKDGLMIVDDTAGEWLLKSSAGDIMIYNEVLNPQ